MTDSWNMCRNHFMHAQVNDTLLKRIKRSFICRTDRCRGKKIKQYVNNTITYSLNYKWCGVSKTKTGKQKDHHFPSGSKLTNNFLNVVKEQFDRILTHYREGQKAVKNTLSSRYQFKKSCHKGYFCRVANTITKALKST